MDKAVAVKPRWGRRIGIAFAILIVLLVALYFVATSSAFLKSVILPRASKSLNAQITVDDVSISPFSQVILKNLRVQTTGTEPLVAAREVRLRYSLMDIIKGHINVHEATLDTPTINLIKEADGSSNLDPLLKGEKKPEETKPSDKKTDLNIKNVALKNGTVRITQKLKQGGPNTTELTGVNVTLDQLKSGGPGKLAIVSDLRMHNRPAANSNDVLAAKINGAYDFALTPDLAPQSVKGSTKIQVTSAEGSFKDAAGLTANLEADATPTQINQLGFRFERSGTEPRPSILGQLRIHGPFDLAKTEGTLAVELVGIDKNILNIAAAGIDFGASTINSTNRVEVKNKATAVAIDGKLFGKQLGITRDQKPTPPVDLDFDYKLAADLNAETAALDRILLSARHKNAEFLTAKLDRPMNLSWGGAAPEMKESAFRLVVTNLNLADWQAMLGTNQPSGIVNVGLVALAQDNGKKLALDLNAIVDQFGMTMGTNAIKNAQIAFNSKGTMADLKRVDLPEFAFAIRSNNAPTLTAKGAAKYDLDSKAYEARVNADSSLPKLLAQVQKSSPLSSGLMTVTANVKGSTNDTQINADVTLTNLVVPSIAQSLPTNGLGLALNVDANMRGQTVDLKQLDLKLSPTKRAENRLQIQAKIDMSTNNAAPGAVTIKSPGLDLTPYYDMFAAAKTNAPAETSTASTTPPPSSTTPAPTDANAEPAPVNLPFKQFTSSVAIDKFFLREIAISNWVTTMTISNNNVALNPLKLDVNGGPVTGNIGLNLGVPGYTYDINLNVDRVPLEAFANTFATTQSNQVKGLLVADARIRGAGTTGASLQKNLQGNVTFAATNMNLRAAPKWQMILVAVAAATRVPEIAQTPINWIDARTTLGNGKVNVEKAAVETEAFLADITGAVTLEKVLTNSTLNLPVKLSVRRSYAEKAGIAPANTPPDAKFVALPDFLTITGTVGKPDQKIDLLKLGISAAAKFLPGEAGQIAQGLGNLLNKDKSSTNAPGTNANTGARLIQGLGGVLGGSRTNASTNAPAANTNKPGLFDLLPRK